MKIGAYLNFYLPLNYKGKKLVSTFPLGVPIPFKNASRFPLVHRLFSFFWS